MIARSTVMTAMIGVIGALMLSIATSARAARSTDACSILSVAQVGAALGASVTMVSIGSDAKHCHWEQQGSHGETIVDARLLIEAAKTYDTAKPMMGMSGKVTQHRGQRRGRRCLLFGGRPRHAPVCEEGEMWRSAWPSTERDGRRRKSNPRSRRSRSRFSASSKRGARLVIYAWREQRVAARTSLRRWSRGMFLARRWLFDRVDE